MQDRWQDLLARWLGAGLIDPATADRIRAFEAERVTTSRLEWPIILALVLGGIAIGAGLLLFVAANWDRISPGTRFVLVLFLVAVFHLAGAMSARDSRAFQSALHGIGTVALGAAIAFTGQIFHLPVDWPMGTLLWAFGAFSAWLLLRDTVQFTMVAVLVPFYLAAQFLHRWPRAWSSIFDGLLLLSLCYLGAVSTQQQSGPRLALMWIGGILLLPLTIAATFAPRFGGYGPEMLALVLPLGLAIFLRRKEAWVFGLFALWILVFRELAVSHSFLLHLWSGVGSIGLVAWGWRDGRKERINLGVAGFALSVIFFYVSNVLDKLGRSASLITLGVILLAGGWALERLRRRLVASV